MTPRDRRAGSEARSCTGQTEHPVTELGWKARRDLGLHPGLPESGWRRVFALWSFTAVPFFSAFNDPDSRR